MNRGRFFKDLLQKVIDESYTCGNYAGCYRLHVKDWQKLVHDDDDLTVMTLLEDLQIMTVRQMDDLVWEDSPMFSYQINFDEINEMELSTELEDKAVNKILRSFMPPRIF